MKPENNAMKKKMLLLLPILTLYLTACEPGPKTIYYGEEECAHCSMIISEPQFAAQLVTAKGRHFNFDAIECLAAYVEVQNIATGDIHSMWVPNFNDESVWVEAENAFYLRSDNLPSPMRLNLSAYPDREPVEEQRRKFNGEILSWNEAIELVRQEWLRN